MSMVTVPGEQIHSAWPIASQSSSSRTVLGAKALVQVEWALPGDALGAQRIMLEGKERQGRGSDTIQRTLSY